MPDLAQYKSQVAELARKREHAIRDAESAAREREEADQTQNAAQEALAAAQTVAQEVQEQAHRKIAGLVTRALQAVFGDEYEFAINWERKRGKTEARMMIHRDGLELSPLDACGGGVVDVASLALRLAALRLHRPPLRQLIVADEPLKWLDKTRRPAAARVLEQLAEELDVQLFFVTHLPELELGTVVRLED